MSAFLCERHHIIYLVQAALDHYKMGSYLSHRAQVPEDDLPVKLCEILWLENMASLFWRYGDAHAEGLASEQSPPFTKGEYNRTCFTNFTPGQIVQSAKCYRYQACEHEGWEDCFAHRFIIGLIDSAAQSLVQDDDVWGAPEPIPGAVRLIG